MANAYQNPLFEKFKKAKESRNTGGGFKNVLKTKPENTYLVRIVPNPEDMDKTTFQYFTHGWTSATDGRYVSTVCPTTYGEDCPICTERFRLWNKGDEASKELSKNLARKERFFANVFVVDDPVTPENNGTVKILGYGRQLGKVIDEATDGDDAEEVGGRMIDFTKEGCNLRIKVEKNKAGFPNYDRSKFTAPSAISIALDDAVEQSHDFDPMLTRKTHEEMKVMIENALYGAEESGSAEPEESIPDSKADNEALDAIEELAGKSTPKKASKKASKKEEDIPMDFDKPTEEDDILNELENL
jgi:hypothetical protein